jgi:hypothetical protein
LEDEVFKEPLELKQAKRITIKARSKDVRMADESVKLSDGQVPNKHRISVALNKKDIKSIRVRCRRDRDNRLIYRVNVIHPKKVIHSEAHCGDDSMKPSLKCDIIHNSSSSSVSKPVLVPVAIILIVFLIILIVFWIWNSFWNFFIKDPAQDDPKPNPIKTRKPRLIGHHLST